MALASAQAVLEPGTAMAVPAHLHRNGQARPRGLLLPGELPPPKIFRPCMAVRTGRRGKGKSVSLVAEGYFFKRMFQAKNLPFRVVANFHTWGKYAGADFSRPYLVEEVAAFPHWCQNIRIALEEITVYFHRRRWWLQQNMDWQTFITQTRKRSVEISAATQFPQRLDSDIVDQIDLFIECEMFYGGCGIPGHQFCVMQRIYDWWGQWTGKTWRKPWPPNPWEWDRCKWFHNLDWFFNAYDTNEIFTPQWQAGRDREIQRTWGDEIPAGINYGKGVTKEQLAEIHAAAQESREGIRKEHEKEGPMEPYDPDLSVGMPHPNDLAEFIRSKAMRLPQNTISLRGILKEIQNIDPNIASVAHLSGFCLGQGWRIQTQGTSSYVTVS